MKLSLVSSTLLPSSCSSLSSAITRCVSLLQRVAAAGAVSGSQQVHSHAIVTGLLHKAPSITTTLIAAYSKCCLPSHASLVFHTSPLTPNLFVWNALITGLAGLGLHVDALSYFRTMNAAADDSVTPDEFTFPCVLKACSNLDLPSVGLSVHARVLKLGFHFDAFVSSSLVNFYLKFDLPEGARIVFDEITDKDVVLWNSLINGYAKVGMFDSALNVFTRMTNEEGIKPSKYTLSGVLSILGSIRDLRWGVRIHDYAKENGLDRDLSIWNALIDMYGKCGCLSIADQLFDEMPVKDIFSWNTIILCYSNYGDHDGCLRFYDRMRSAEGLHVVPDGVTFTAVLPCCGQLGALKRGREIHGLMVVTGVGKKDLFVLNSLMDMYGKCGCVREAHRIFVNGMPDTERDLASWNILVMVYGMHGYAD